MGKLVKDMVRTLNADLKKVRGIFQRKHAKPAERWK